MHTSVGDRLLPLVVIVAVEFSCVLSPSLVRLMDSYCHEFAQ